MSCLQNFSSKEKLNNHKKRCLLINDIQVVKYETEIIKLKKIEKQTPIPFKVYPDTECFLKRIKIDEGKYTKLYQKHIRNSLGAKLVCIDNRITLPSIVSIVKIVSINLLNEFLHNKNKLIKQLMNILIRN